MPQSSTHEDTPGSRPIRRSTRALRTVVFLGSILVFAVGVPLFLGSEHTDVNFAWTIEPPLTAAFLGAAYWSSFFLGAFSFRHPDWHRLRIGVFGTLVFTVLTFATTLLHLERFHFTSPHSFARFVAWLWVGLYASVPASLLLFLIPQLRQPGGDPPTKIHLPSWIRAYFLALGFSSGLLGLALFLSPTATIPMWPWDLTVLTARAIGAWLMTIGFLSAQVVVENDGDRVGPAFAAVTALGVLGLVALSRFRADLRPTSPSTWPFIMVLISLALVGILAWVGSRKGQRRDAP